MTRPRISAKAERFTESVIREMNRLAVAAGAISLAQGFPDFACPPELKAAAAAAVDDDINQYAITWGSKPLRDAIAASTVRHFPGWGTIDPETQITVTCGATEAMMAAMLGLLDPGDEIVVFEPSNAKQSAVTAVTLSVGALAAGSIGPRMPGRGRALRATAG